jgi:hypothetical protein
MNHTFDIRHALSKLKKMDDAQTHAFIKEKKEKGIGLWDHPNLKKSSWMTLDLLVSTQKNNVIWDVLGELEDSKTSERLENGEQNPLCIAIRMGNTPFLQEWVRNGWPLRNKSWECDPLCLAIQEKNAEAVEVLLEAGVAPQNELSHSVIGREWDFSMRQHKTSRLKLEKTSALAMAYAQSSGPLLSKFRGISFDRASLMDHRVQNPMWKQNHIGQPAKEALLNEPEIALKQVWSALLGPSAIKGEIDFERMNANQALTAIIEENERLPSNSKLSQELIEHLATLRGPSKTQPIFSDLTRWSGHQESWWRIWRLEGMFAALKETDVGQRMDWEKILDNVSFPNLVSRGLAASKDMQIDEGIKKACFELLISGERMGTKKSMLTEERVEAVWGDLQYAKKSVRPKDGNGRWKFRGMDDKAQVSAYGFTVLSHWKSPKYWKVGATTKETAKEFWSDVETLYRADNRLELGGHAFPVEWFGIDQKHQVQNEKTWDVFANAVGAKNWTSMFERLLKTKNANQKPAVAGGVSAISPVGLCVLGGLMVWGVKRKHILASQIFSALQSAVNTWVFEDRLEKNLFGAENQRLKTQFEGWKKEIESLALKESIGMEQTFIVVKKKAAL